MTVNAVIFDIGNVLIEWNPERHFDGTIGPDRRKRLFAEVDLHAMNLSVDRGAPFRDSVMALADRHPEWAAEIRDWHDSWIHMVSPEMPHSVHLLRALRAKGIPVFALSNFGIDTFDLAATHYPFFHEFDRRYVSGHLKMLKPEPEIFAHVESDCGLAPETLLFTDDVAENIAGAAARGWATHLFTHPLGWADRLVAEGLLTQSEATP
ncbi:HAD family phosphatase [Oceaniovalibus sp. ACAM 378]|uniref:HAD family hydrolase n=1 Tax=Oceaniovalibus sp. ACAM 378 TaxID=2599923 RepID=UPI0011DBEFD1|nr:HAD family phosphatase [Oceaniovalibus sp. ACAM 378]TYB88623.1 HAD family phosphatase [Oceaniovalibus sp. ACAM 378]